jgi:hypothetical protein
MNGFEYGWGETNEPTEKFWVRFGHASREVQDWKEELYAAARAIANVTTKPLILALSGGIDGEVMGHAFFDQGINFSVMTLEYPEGLNEHDISYAKKWCALRRIPQEIVRLDIRDFLRTTSEKYGGEGYITGNIFRYLQIKLLELAEERGGYAVLGGGEHVYTIDDTDTEPTMEDVYLNFEVGYAACLEWCRRNNANHQPYFYFSKPEIALAYLRIPFVDFALKHPTVFRNRNNRFLLKQMVYQMEWPALEPRQKFNGFEKVRELRREAEENIKREFAPLLQSYRLYIPNLREQVSVK